MTSDGPTPANANGSPAAYRTALVTGASSGIGAAFAERLAHDGADVILVARRRERLEALAERLRANAGVAATVLAADLTDAAELAEVERAIAACATLDLLVNCAGVAGYMPFVELPPEQAESLVRLHVIAPTRLTRAALPGMVERGRGAVINVSSGLAFTASLPAPPLPKRAVYAASKSYINTFTEILADELRGTGVRVQAFCPGVVRTELHDVAGFDVARVQRERVQVPAILEPDVIVAASLASLDLGEVVCVPTLEDTAALAALAESRTRVFAGVRRSEVAQRYGPAA